MAIIEDTLTNLISGKGAGLSRAELDAALLQDFKQKPTTVDTAVPPPSDRWGELPAGYIANTSPDWARRAEISPKIYGAGGPEAPKEGAKLQSTANPLADAMLRASTAKTPDELLNATQALIGQQAAYEAKKNEEALSAAAIKLGLPQLEQRLNQEISADQNDPKYTGYDSKITAEVRSQLERAKVESRIVANQLIATDPELARMKVETNFMANKASANAMKMMQRDEIQTEKDLEKGSLISDKTVSALKYFYPGETLGKSRGAMFDFHKNNKDKEIQAVADNADRPEVLLDLAVTKGSGRAKDFLVHQSAVETSGSSDTTSEAYLMAKDKVNLDLVELDSLARNPEAAIKLAFGTSKSDEAKKAITNFTMTLQSKTPSQQDEYKKQVGLEYAKQVIEQKKVAEFSMLSNWKESEKAALQANPLTNDLITRAASKKGGRTELVTLESLVTEINLLDPAKQSEAFQFLLNSAGNEVELRNKGLFGLNTNKYEMEKNLKTLLMSEKLNLPTNTLGTLMGRGLSEIGQFAQGFGQFALTPLAIPGAASAELMRTSLEDFGNIGTRIMQRSAASAAKITGTGKYTNPRTGEQK